ncbi:MAG: hypothetical protein AAGF26_01760 [Cyanobacteria bacterium P01_G01_bin.49]
MSNYKWASIVYSRTYEVDFRLLAVPENFNANDKQWSLDYILATTRSAKELSEKPRWSLFKNSKYCVIGVTCMLRDLISQDSQISEDMTKDSKLRPLYGFFGYVSKVGTEGKNSDFPFYRDNDIKLFKPLYQYISEQWLVKNYEELSRVSKLTEYRDLDYVQSQPSTDDSMDSNLLQLNYQYQSHRYSNQSRQQIFLWPDSKESRRKLWISAYKCKYPTSLYLGLVKENDILSSPFLNGTNDKITKQKIIDRYPQNVNEWDEAYKALEPNNSSKTVRRMTDVNNKRRKDSRQNQKNFDSPTNDSQEFNVVDWVVQKAKDDLKQTKKDVNKLLDFMIEDESPKNTDNTKYSREKSKDKNRKKGQKRRNNSSGKTKDFGFKPKEKEENSQEKDWF